MKSFRSDPSSLIVVAVIIFLTFVFPVQSFASTLQIDPVGDAPNWDRLNTTQTGAVGVTSISFTTTRTFWAATFVDENSIYRTTGFGSLTRPPGDDTGDFLGIYIDKGDIFTITVTLNGDLKDPVFYFHDLDAVGATLTLPLGFDVAQHNTDGSLSGIEFTVSSGFIEGTAGAAIAVQYLGTFSAINAFVFEFDYSNVVDMNNEVISMGMASDTKNINLSKEVQDTSGAPLQTAGVNDSVIYHLEASNFTGTTATGVVVTDTLPTGISYASSTTNPNVAVTTNGQDVIWNIGMLEGVTPNNVATLDINALVLSTSGDQSIRNTAVVSAIDSPFATGPEVSADLCVTTEADLEVITVGRTDQDVPSSDKYQTLFDVQLMNNGPGAACGFVLTFDLVNSMFDPVILPSDPATPADTLADVLECTDTPDVPTFGQHRFRCELPHPLTYAANTMGSVVVLQVDRAGNVCESPENTNVSSLTSDPDLSNNDFSHCVPVIDTDGQIPDGDDCFIATAAYGSYLDPEVKLLREFRDQWLLTNEAGRAFVNWYYKTSPPYAAIIAESKLLRSITRIALTPLVYGIKYPVGTVFIVLVIIGWRVRRRIISQTVNKEGRSLIYNYK